MYDITYTVKRDITIGCITDWKIIYNKIVGYIYNIY